MAVDIERKHKLISTLLKLLVIEKHFAIITDKNIEEEDSNVNH